MTERAKKLLKINIRNLAEIVFAEGSLGSISPSGISAQLGIEIHLKYQTRPIAGYQNEVSLCRVFDGDYIILEISGKVDGIYSDVNGVHIEEIKTMRVGTEEIKKTHLAQLKLYGFFYSLEKNIDSLFLDLIYYNRSSGDEKIFSEETTREKLESECMQWINAYLQWNDKNEKHRIELRTNLEKMQFPFCNFRKGQRDLSKAVYCSIRDEAVLFAEAPTGTGKTAAVLFPALKAVSENLTEKIFYLTAKNAGAETAEKTAALFNSNSLNIRWISLTAKAKICFTNENDSEKPDCDSEKCPYSLDYYVKLPEALNSIFTENAFSRDRIEFIAKKFQICPFELSLDLSLFCDLIICDYNYAFDLSSKLKRFFSFGKTNHTFLIDEAHNMIDRARAMFSSEIKKSRVMELKKETSAPLKNVLSMLNSEFIILKKQYSDSLNICEISPPDSLIKSARKCLREFDLFIEQHGKLPAHIVNFYWELIEFTTIADHYSASFRTIIKISSIDVVISLNCIDPSDEIQEILKNQKSAVFFSATLSPSEYYKKLLAPSMESISISLNSPFNPDNCLYFIKTNLSTRYKFREINSTGYAETVRNIINNIKGNIAIFSPSFKFQANILYDLSVNELNVHDGIKSVYDTAIQKPKMTEDEKVIFLNRFHDSKNLRAFCVAGGSFAESIDLPGDKLIGVIIFGVGLPQINFENDVIKNFFDEKYDRGYPYSYMFPGFNKVLQAAGRVIRAEDDKGFILLIDDRYGTPEYKKLIPKHWKITQHNDSAIERILYLLNNKFDD